MIGEQDKTAFTPQVVDMIISGAKQLEPSAFDVIERVDGGHCLMISRPYWLAGVLRKAAGEVLPDKPMQEQAGDNKGHEIVAGFDDVMLVGLELKKQHALTSIVPYT